jgi:hypothetical protein
MHRTLAAVELRLGGILDDCRPHLDEPLHLARRHRSVRHTLVRLAAKRFADVAQQPDRHLGVATAQRLTCCCDQPGHPFRIDLDKLGIQSIPATNLDDRRRAEGPTQPQDVSLQRLARRRRPTRWPQRLL